MNTTSMETTLEDTMRNERGLMQWMVALALLMGCHGQPQDHDDHDEAAEDRHESASNAAGSARRRSAVSCSSAAWTCLQRSS
jgi:hypothetical protein